MATDPRSVSASAERTDPRAVALGVIRRVTESGAYSNLALAAALRRSKLDRRDRDLVAELTYGTLRHLLALDRAVGRHTNRPLAQADPLARALLRLGAYQLLHTRIPAHAAVGETVGLAPTRQRGFVNAVLRKLAAAPTPSAPAGTDDDTVSLRTGMAPWMLKELRRLLPPGEVEPAAAALASRAALSLRVNRCRATPEEVEHQLRTAGLDPRPGGIDPDCLLVEGADPAGLPGFTQGHFAVQDQASAFVVRALDPRPGHRVLDACAGPGGKAAFAACLVQPDGLVVAADAVPRRAGLVAATATRLGVPVRTLAMDARQLAIAGSFDRILVDAPCSGLGSARRRPELLWRPKREQLSDLARLQVAIVASVAELLEPGGRLVYSVCTFPRAETDAACDAIVRHAPFLRPTDLPTPGGPAPRTRLWPHRHGTDAMFVAAFTRAA